MSGSVDDHRVARGPSQQDYDVVVVGSGLGGLSAAALLARAGLHVLVVERGDGPGGCAHAFRRGPYLFDPAVHFTVEAGPGGFLDQVLGHLGVRDECALERVDHAFGAVFPGMSFAVPADPRGAVDTFTDLFPGEADALEGFFRLVERFFAEAAQLTMRLSVRELEGAVERFPTFFSHRNATLASVLDQHLADPQARAAVSAIWPYFGLPPSQISFYQYAQTLSVMLRGTYTSRGSFQRLVDAFVVSLERDGGELVVGHEVVAIPVDDGRATGIELADGTRVRAPVVISNADPLRTFEQLVDTEHVPAALRRRLGRMELSISAFLVCAATDLEVDEYLTAHETVVYDRWDLEETFRAVLRCEPAEILVNAPSMTDPTLAPDGEHVLVLGALAPYEHDRGWPQAKEPFADEVVARVEHLLPGLADRLTFVEAATPETVERFTGNRQGAIYGWALTRRQAGTRRSAHETPIDGLYLSGAWTHEGPGSFRVVLSGVRTADIVLRRLGLGHASPDLRPPDLPTVSEAAS